MPHPTAEPAAGSTTEVRSSRPIWRVCFIAYAIVLTTATHWPRLELGSEEMPAPDKLIHLLAFATLTILMWRSGWFAREFAIIAIGWATFDEVTQALPGLGRDVTLADWMSSLLGVLIVIAIRWALQPIGNADQRARYAFHAAVFDRMFLRPSVWLITGLGVLAATAVLGPLVFLMTRLGLGAELIDSILLGLVAGGVVGAHVTLEGQWRRACRTEKQRRPCSRCGTACADRPVDERATTTCAACGQAQWIGQWSCRPRLPRATLLKLSQRPTLITLAFAVAIGIGYWIVAVFRNSNPIFEALDYWYLNTTADQRLTIDLTIIALLIALWIRLFRGRLAARMEAAHLRCIRCEQDLRGTPTKQGMGQCSECGMGFVAEHRAT